MVNPFQFGGIVRELAFCNRKEELRDLTQAAENGDRLLIYAERRVGKTSLIQRVLQELPRKQFLPFYVDLWATSDASSFIQKTAKAIAEASATTTDRLLEVSQNLFRRLSPSLTIDEQGNPSLHLGVRKGETTEPELEEVLDAPARLAAQTDRRVVMVYDEIQQIAEYGDDTVERTLRSRVQFHQDIAYFFLGSRKHLVRQLFMEKKRPLYQAAGYYPLGAIELAHWKPFIRERFESAGKKISDAGLRALYAQTEGHPYYTQHLAHALWELTPEGKTATKTSVRKAVDVLLRRLSYTYTVLWESLTPNQRQLLIGMAREAPEAQPFSSSFLQKYNLPTASAHRAAEGLLEKDIIDRQESGYAISDRFLQLWVKGL